jgi:hypothetical protein
VVCNRVESDREAIGDGEGWIHVLTGNARVPTTTDPAVEPTPRMTPEAIINVLHIPAIETSEADRRILAAELRVSTASIARLRFAYDRLRDVWLTPMCDGDGEYIGIQRRLADGQKRCVPGSRLGVFIPQSMPISDGTILICEGASDTAAALDLGFNAIGRASCRGCTEYLTTFLANHPHVRPIVVADADAPGLLGARALAERLVENGVRKRVRVITPPAGYKDLRACVGDHRKQLEIVTDYINTQIKGEN